MATLLEDEFVASGGEKIFLTYHGQEGEEVGWEAEIVGAADGTLKGHGLSLERAIFSALRAGDDEPEVTPVQQEAVMADKLVELGVTSVSGVYNYPPPPVDDAEEEEGSWTATVGIQGNPFVGEGASFDEAVDAAIEAYETRGQEEAAPAPAPVAKSSPKAAEKS